MPKKLNCIIYLIKNFYFEFEIWKIDKIVNSKATSKDSRRWIGSNKCWKAYRRIDSRWTSAVGASKTTILFKPNQQKVIECHWRCKSYFS